jgi:hypothetical protein
VLWNTSLVVYGVGFALNRNERHMGKKFCETKLNAYLELFLQSIKYWVFC